MNKVLIITYYWPPSGGSRTQRWLKFSKYLPKNGWKPIIYTPISPSFDIEDKDLLNDIEKDRSVENFDLGTLRALEINYLVGLRILILGIIQDKSIIKNKIFNWIRGNFFIPDPKIYWVKPSIKYLSKKLKEERVTHIVSTGPPHSMHLIGLGLKKKNPKLKWIAGFRDPWSELDLLDEFNLTRRSRTKYQELERKVLDNSDVCRAVSETWVDSFKRLGSRNVKLITNGFDEDDFNVLRKRMTLLLLDILNC